MAVDWAELEREAEHELEDLEAEIVALRTRRDKAAYDLAQIRKAMGKGNGLTRRPTRQREEVARLDARCLQALEEIGKGGITQVSRMIGVEFKPTGDSIRRLERDGMVVKLARGVYAPKPLGELAETEEMLQ